MKPEELRELARERREKLGNKHTRVTRALDGAADEIERLTAALEQNKTGTRDAENASRTA